MELYKIEEILEKYFDAETTNAEELELKSYFSSDNVAPHLESYKSMFGFYANAKNETSEKELTTLPTAKRKNVSSWLSIAASVVIMLGIGTFVYYNGSDSANDLGTYDDPEIALAQTQKALSLLSSNVNKGMESVDYIGQYDQAKDKVFTK